jgi:large subunit ribosomal protein L11
LQNMPLESLSKSIIGTASSMGIKIVKDLEWMNDLGISNFE